LKTIGEKIRLLRLEREWKQEDVAKKLRISVPAYSKIECGHTDINLSRLEQIAGLFGLSAMQVMMFNDERQVAPVVDAETLAKQLEERGAEMIELQKQVIKLYEELRAKSRH